MNDKPSFLFAAGALSSTLVLGALWWYVDIYNTKSHLKIAEDTSGKEEIGSTGVGIENALEDEILAEQFTRNVQFFGNEGQAAIHKAFVLIVGLGGVGSHAAHMLLRAGVGRLRIIDFDQVSLSSLNRHAVATRADVGLPKATVLKNHFAKIVPEASVEAIVAMYSQNDEERLLGGNPDYVIDAIDDIETKVALLVACKRRGIPILCACGAGAKADPSRVRIADLSEASSDPLARKVRYKLRHEHGIMSSLPMVLSTEKPRCNLIPVKELTHDPYDLQIIPNFRIRTVPVLGTTPAIFGMTASSWVLCHLANKPYIPEPIFNIKGSEYEHLLSRLIDREELVFGNHEGVDLDLEEVIYLAKSVWRVRSAKSDPSKNTGEKGLTRYLGDLLFTRWDRQKGPTPDNLILLNAKEAEDHDEISIEQLRKSDPDFVKHITKILSSVQDAFGIN